MNRTTVALLAFAAAIGFVSWMQVASTRPVIDTQWREYLGGPDRNHFSPLTQIDSSNVNQLQVAWQYRTGDSGQIQCNPIMVDGVLYGMTAAARPFALDAATGKEMWKKKLPAAIASNTSRGVTYWEKGADKRILFTSGMWLYAVDARSGKPVAGFGQAGRVSLKTGLGKTAAEKYVVSNTPGTVFENLIIMPIRLSEGNDAALGHVQAFDILTGKLAWVFQTIPGPGTYGYETFPANSYKNTDVGGVNNWAGMAIDRKRGMVYVPTGSAAFDFYGGNRKGANLFANCLLALDARTGKRRWHYQIVHHDILDRDLPAPPNLLTVMHKGKKVDAVAQVTKHGYIFLFDRENGTPLFPIQERKVPLSTIPGEHTWPTQPFPEKPAPLTRPMIRDADIGSFTTDRTVLLKAFKSYVYDGPFTPLAKKPTIVFPGLDGGAEWGGAAADPQGVLYVNSSEVPWLLTLGPAESKAAPGTTRGQQLYQTRCASCHGRNLKGNTASGFPSLVNIGARRTRSQVMQVVTHGKGMMPSFVTLSGQDRKAVVGYLFGERPQAAVEKEPGLQPTKKNDPPYRITGFTKFLDSAGLPAITPPWGTLNAIDLNTGAYLWKVPFGEYPELMARGLPVTGAESYGGPVVTASGLLFIAATKDRKFRVYDKRTGRLLWETLLPAAGFATPSTYMAGGKQYVVIACGGGKLGAPAGDSYVAFALP